MKNIQVLITPDEIRDFTDRLWRTNEFRDSCRRGGLVHQVVDKFSRYPKFFYEATDPYLEAGHFTSWWGGMQLRENEYALDGIHDLYYLHEFVHAGTMPVHPGLEYETFMRILGDNEADASTVSEIAAYFDMPALRAKSFTFEIYADRFLKDPAYHTWWKDNRDDFLESIKYKRRNLMHPAYQPKDSPELWIHNFAAQNMALGDIWRDRVDVVEKMIWDFRSACRNPAIGPAAAMQSQMAFLLSDDITGGTDIPFAAEAKAAAPIIWANKTKYAASLKAASPPASPAPPAP